MLGKTDWWITMYDTVLRKQVTKYFESEFELDKFKRSLKSSNEYVLYSLITFFSIFKSFKLPFSSLCISILPSYLTKIALFGLTVSQG